MRAGVRYRHYKGGEYTVICPALDSTNPPGEGKDASHQLCIVYVSLQTGNISVRTAAQFNEKVIWPDGEVRPRFAQLEEE